MDASPRDLSKRSTERGGLDLARTTLLQDRSCLPAHVLETTWRSRRALHPARHSRTVTRYGKDRQRRRSHVEMQEMAVVSLTETDSYPMQGRSQPIIIGVVSR